jgi:hypothetical protein
MRIDQQIGFIRFETTNAGPSPQPTVFELARRRSPMALRPRLYSASVIWPGLFFQVNAAPVFLFSSAPEMDDCVKHNTNDDDGGDNRCCWGAPSAVSVPFSPIEPTFIGLALFIRHRRAVISGPTVSCDTAKSASARTFCKGPTQEAERLRLSYCPDMDSEEIIALFVFGVFASAIIFGVAAFVL